MKCKNCGARLGDNEKVCPNCGAAVDGGEGYVLLTSDGIEYEDYYSSGKNKKKSKSGFTWFLSIVLTLAIIGCGAYFYFNYFYEKADPQPSLTFESGCGIINGDEKIIYVTVENGENIEFIHGVNLVNLAENNSTKQTVSTKYEYTKSINDSFRAIFFDADELKLKDIPYKFEMQFSFSGSDTIYTYSETVTYDSKTDKNVADIIFDHSVEGESTVAAETTTEKVTEQTTSEATTASGADIDFIYDTYWFGEPKKDGDKLTVYAYKFDKNGTCTATKYYKDGDKDWEITTEKPKTEISDYSVTVDGAEYLINAVDKALEGDVGKLTSRRYNSVENAEDLFGI